MTTHTIWITRSIMKKRPKERFLRRITTILILKIRIPVIYGHDMRNGSMFKGLLDYRDKTFFDQNKEVLIYTPDAIRHYKIFAAYPYDSRHLLRSFDFTDKEVYQQYLYRIFATAI